MNVLRGRAIAVCVVGWFVSAGVVWSAAVYALPTGVAALLLLLPWALAAGALSVAAQTRTDIRVDLTKVAVQGGLHSEHFDTGDVVVREGDAAEHFYIITRGRAAVLVDDGEYAQTEVGELVAGQFFGEAGLLTGGSRTATVQATEPLDVLIMDKASFAGLMGSDATLSRHVREVARQRTRR